MKKFIFGIIFMFSSITFAGSVSGPQHKKDTVNGYSTDVYNVVFEEERLAIVRVSGDGSTDLDCFVYDNKDNLIGEDTNSVDECLITFAPKWTGKFKIKIKNLGSKPNEYSLYIN
jgi:uncharacterized membrane protein